jgi:hypothetical protein
MKEGKRRYVERRDSERRKGTRGKIYDERIKKTCNMRSRDGRHMQVYQKRDIDRDGRGGEQGIGGGGTME